MLNELQTISKLIETASLEENPLEMLKTSYLGEKQHYFCLVWFFLVVIPDTHVLKRLVLGGIVCSVFFLVVLSVCLEGAAFCSSQLTRLS